MNDTYGELRREALLQDLHQRVRDVVEGPDGFIYVLTDGPENAVLRIEPAP
jgi:glucose/arabinose dehydrogenase